MSNPFKVGDIVEVVNSGDDLVPGSTHTLTKIEDIFVTVEPGGANNTSFYASRFKLRKAGLQVVPTRKPRGQAGGLKYDKGKAQWGLLMSAKGMLAAVTGVVSVLTFGAKKYAAHSWREVEDNERRYLDGLMRHYVALMEHGLKAVDSESCLLHIDHLNCNGLFLAELARNANKVE